MNDHRPKPVASIHSKTLGYHRLWRCLLVDKSEPGRAFSGQDSEHWEAFKVREWDIEQRAVPHFPPGLFARSKCTDGEKGRPGPILSRLTDCKPKKNRSDCIGFFEALMPSCARHLGSASGISNGVVSRGPKSP
jgi:hypothetical protein